eukprot:35088-Eustigmatos_ZCMA.PRE.1
MCFRSCLHMVCARLSRCSLSPIPLQLQHAVDHVREYLGPRQVARLCHMPEHHHCHPVALGELHEPCRHRFDHGQD